MLAPGLSITRTCSRCLRPDAAISAPGAGEAQHHLPVLRGSGVVTEPRQRAEVLHDQSIRICPAPIGLARPRQYREPLPCATLPVADNDVGVELPALAQRCGDELKPRRDERVGHVD